MALEIFWASGSPFSWRVMLALEHKGIPYESRLLEFSKRETETPEFRAINPRGQVPALRDGAFVLAESLAILAYLEARYPSPPLFGQTPEEVGRVWQAVQACSLYLDGPGEAFVLPMYFGVTEDKEPAIRAALPRVHAELARWETALGQGPWLVLPTLSAADLVVFPMVKSLLRAAGKPAAARFEPGLLPLEARYPRLAGWMARIEQLPGYDRTYPPHWRVAAT
jgi:glutathione S-transferase